MCGANEVASPPLSLGESSEDSGMDPLDVDAGYNDEELEIIESRTPAWGLLPEKRMNVA